MNKVIDSMHLVGYELNEFDPGKVQKRSMFDKNVVTSMANLEHVLDYTFSHLGLSGDSSIQYPVLMTESMCNPNYTRTNMSELLFECYDVPGVSYCVDSLLSFYLNSSKEKSCSFIDATNSSTGTILSSSHQTTHIIPVVDSEIQLSHTKRLNIGGH